MPADKLTDAQFQKAQDKVDDLTRKTRNGTKGSAEDIALYQAIHRDWEAAYSMPYVKYVDRERRWKRIHDVAVQYGLLL